MIGRMRLGWWGGRLAVRRGVSRRLVRGRGRGREGTGGDLRAGL